MTFALTSFHPGAFEVGASTLFQRLVRDGSELISTPQLIGDDVELLTIWITVDEYDDFASASNSLRTRIDVSPDGGQSWITQYDTTFLGGQPTGKGACWGWCVYMSGLNRFSGQHIRVYNQQFGSFRFGVDWEFS